MDILEGLGIKLSIIRAGKANMFLSSLFRDALSTLTGVAIELFDTDGSVGAARGAGVGVGYYKSFEEAFQGLNKIERLRLAMLRMMKSLNSLFNLNFNFDFDFHNTNSLLKSSI